MRVTAAGLGFMLQRLLKDVEWEGFAVCPFDESDRIRNTRDHIFYRDDNRPVWLTLTEKESVFPLKQSIYSLSLSFEDPRDFQRANCASFVEAMQAMFATTDDSINICTFKRLEEVDLVALAKRLELILGSVFCQCQRHMIHDDESLCLQCSLTLSEDDVKCHFCSICQENKAGRMARTRCCGQHFHRQCIRDKVNARCPLCRHTLVLI